MIRHTSGVTRVPVLLIAAALAIPFPAHGQAAMVTVSKVGASATPATVRSTSVSDVSAALTEGYRIAEDRGISKAGQSAGVFGARSVGEQSASANAVGASQNEKTAAVVGTRSEAAPNETEHNAATTSVSTAAARRAASYLAAAGRCEVNAAPTEAAAATGRESPARYSAFSLASRNAAWASVANRRGGSRLRNTGASSETAVASTGSHAAVSRQNEATHRSRSAMNPPGRRP